MIDHVDAVAAVQASLATKAVTANGAFIGARNENIPAVMLNADGRQRMIMLDETSTIEGVASDALSWALKVQAGQAPRWRSLFLDRLAPGVEIERYEIDGQFRRIAAKSGDASMQFGCHVTFPPEGQAALVNDWASQVKS